MVKNQYSIRMVYFMSISSQREGAVGVVSNCKAPSRRLDIANELSKYIKVDLFGSKSCGKTVKPCTIPRNKSSSAVNCHPEISLNYKFYLAFENSLCVDYVTEKFFNVLGTEMIPIVYGGADYKSLFPSYSYIDVLDFPTIKKLGEFLQDLSSNLTKWRKYFEWRKDYSVVRHGYLSGCCEICEKLTQNRTESTSVYKDIYNWWVHGKDVKDEGLVGSVDLKNESSLCNTKQAIDKLIKKITKPA
jgi:hypothetical protein